MKKCTRLCTPCTRTANSTPAPIYHGSLSYPAQTYLTCSQSKQKARGHRETADAIAPVLSLIKPNTHSCMQSEFVARFSVGRTSNYTSPWRCSVETTSGRQRSDPIRHCAVSPCAVRSHFSPVSGPLVLESGSRHSLHRQRHAETETLSHKGHCTHAHVIHHNHRTPPTLCVSVLVYINSNVQ